MRDWERSFLHKPFVPEPLVKTRERDIMDVYSILPFQVRWTDHIIQAVELNFGVTEAEMKSARRSRSIAWPRFAAMHLIRKYRNYSLPMIGQMFGGRDHTTVIHALERVKELQRENRDFVTKLRGAETTLIDVDTSKVWPASAIERLKEQVWTETADA